MLDYDVFAYDDVFVDECGPDNDDERDSDCDPEPCGPDYDEDCLPECEPEENGRWFCNPVED